MSLRHIVERRDRMPVAQQALWGHHNQRAPQWSDHLPPQQVKELGRRGRDTNLHVVVAAQLQEPLEPGGGMLRTLTLHPMGQKECQAAQPLPFGFSAADELVNNDLSAIGEIPELGFPDGECPGFRGGITIFKTQHGLF